MLKKSKDHWLIFLSRMSKQLPTVRLNNNNNSTHASSESPNGERNYNHPKVDESSASLPQGASAAYYMLERGYNRVTFEGPAQGGVNANRRFHLDMIGKRWLHLL